MHKQTLIAFPLILVGALQAQSDGWAPPVHHRRGGNQGLAMPGNWSLGRQQGIIQATDLPPGFVPGKVLVKVAYRRSHHFNNVTIPYLAKSLIMEVSVGNTTVPGSGLTTTWASNRPADLSVVLPAVSVNLPASPVLGVFEEVGPDIVILPFTAPKMFTGPHLFIEHVNNVGWFWASNYWLDSLDGRAIGGHNSVRGLHGCGAAPASPTGLSVIGAATNRLASSTGYVLSNATPRSIYLLTVGFVLDNPYGLSAPFDLAPTGAPGCPFWNTLDVVFLGTTDAVGGGTTRVVWPSDQRLSGAEVGIQALVVSPGFNAAGLTSSNGMSAWIGASWPIASACVVESSLTSTSAPAANLLHRFSLITHLFWN